MQMVLVAMFVLCSSFPLQEGSTPADLFATEPTRPKARAPIQFLDSWDQAFRDSKRTGKRILAIFTGDHCGWCRVLEKRTFTDAEVVTSSGQFICVEINVGDDANAWIVDRYRIDSIPRSLVTTSDGQVIDQRTGYVPAAEYTTWLEQARTKPIAPTEAVHPANLPLAVGSPMHEADVLIWSIDATRSMARWSDQDWTSHVHLLRLLRAIGLHPQVEHLTREEFPTRWDKAEAVAQVPKLIIADKSGGLVHELKQKGRLLPLISDRLTWTPQNAPCPDFAGRSAFVVAGSAHEDAGQKAIAELLKPGPEMALPGPVLSTVHAATEADDIARRAVVAYISGNPVALKAVASPSSPQLTRCTRPEPYRAGRQVFAASADLRGNESIAFARVEMQYRAKNMLGADSVLVILRREASRWKAFAISSEIVSVEQLAAFCRLDLRTQADKHDPPTARLLFPTDGGTIGAQGKSFSWEVPSTDQPPLTAQICQVLLGGEQSSSWPETRLKVFPDASRARSLLYSETAKNLTGVTADHMSWCVWSVGQNGRISVSAVSTYLPPSLKD